MVLEGRVARGCQAREAASFDGDGMTEPIDPSCEQVRHAENLSPVDEFLKQDTLIAIAAKFGSVRLLDNVVIEKDPTIAA